MKQKPLFITIDTEGDNLWDNPSNDSITTNNILWIPKFQDLCEKFGFVPIWLTDYEIIMDNRFVEYIKPKVEKGLCEVGVHLHARNNPPLYSIPGEKEIGAPYLIEYPDDVMEAKFAFLIDLITTRIGIKPVTHRAGRWAIDKRYIAILQKHGIQYDCSVTPGVDWSSFVGITDTGFGTSYKKYKNHKYQFGSIAEYPVTIVKCHKEFINRGSGLRECLRRMYHFWVPYRLWLRPTNENNIDQMKHVLRKTYNSSSEYAEFMIHSSELAPGCSRSFKTEEAIRILYNNMESLLSYAKELGYKGYTFQTWENEQ